MSRWTHAACGDCYDDRYPGRNPIRLREPEQERCCVCGAPTNEGIYIRADPNLTMCRGEHE